MGKKFKVGQTVRFNKKDWKLVELDGQKPTDVCQVKRTTTESLLTLVRTIKHPRGRHTRLRSTKGKEE